MSPETAYDTALAASRAAASSVTRSPSSGSDATKLIDHVQHTETAHEHVQREATDHENETTDDTDEEADKAIFDSFLRVPTRSPSPAITVAKLKSTPPAKTTYLDHGNESDVKKVSRDESHAESVKAHTTPQCKMTGEELGSLRKPGDSVTTKEGHTVQLVEDSEGRRLFLSQVSSGTPPTSYQKPPPESSHTVRVSSQKKPHKRVSMLASIDLSNIIDMTDTEDEDGSRLGTPPTSSMPPSSYSLRNRRAPQGKLIYDAKYHPMDDSIRPSQAAKRRSAHGEIELSSDDESETFSVHSESEDEKEQNTEKLIKKFGSRKSKKRSRSRSESLQPTRRSSRRASNQKVSYNMNVHPQDRYLEVSSSDDEDSEASLHDVKRAKTSRSRRSESVQMPEHRREATSVVIADSEAEDEDEEDEGEESERTEFGKTKDGQSEEGTIRVQVPRQPPTLTSPMSDVTTPPSFGLRRPDELGVYLLSHVERDRSHGGDSWLIKPGLPFEIHSDGLEDQLAAEADAASPLHFDEDDKENEGSDSRYINTPDPLEGMSVIPLSQYRSTRVDAESFNYPAASAAFYEDVHRSFSPYNLGGHDGSDDHSIATEAISKVDVTSLRTARNQQQAPQNVPEQQKEIDSGVVVCSPRPAGDEP